MLTDDAQPQVVFRGVSVDRGSFSAFTGALPMSAPKRADLYSDSDQVWNS